MDKPSITFTPVESIKPRVEELRAAFGKLKTLSYEWRVAQIRKVQQVVKENGKRIQEALAKDLHMDPLLAENEVTSAIEEAEHVIAKLQEWMTPQTVGVHPLTLPGSGKIYKDPLGVVLLISPWNYPVSLITLPLIGAIAAGNCVVIKPSEISVNTSRLLGDILTQALDKDTFFCVQGAVKETTALLQLKFDKIMYTGNGKVGKIVMKAAAEHLTPVLLELGGKSPVVIDESVDLAKAVPKIIWGKFANAGQTCIAPDYVLVHSSKYKDFVRAAKEKIEEFYGPDPSQSGDFGRVINSTHTERISKLIEGGTVECGGKVEIPKCYISPTILTNVRLDSNLMQEEIFGPLLPVIPIGSLKEAEDFIRERPKPLALYVFSSNTKTAEDFFRRTSSGGGCVNDVILHNICPEFCFGGVGDSGMGGYHSKHSFDAFVHQKGILQRPLMHDVSLRFPPYTEAKVSKLRFLSSVVGALPSKNTLTVLGLALVLGIGYYFRTNLWGVCTKAYEFYNATQ